METKAYLKIENVCFSYSKNKTINNISLAVEEGSFTTLLGPSGCGKTTLLKLLSGFLTPQEGNIFINNINQNKLETSQREIGIVFQDYALFPHLTVKENILYGLKIKNKKEKVSSKEFYKNHPDIQQKCIDAMHKASRKYWSDENNRKKFGESIKGEKHPQYGSKCKRARKIYCITTNEYFDCIADAARKYHVCDSAIVDNCKQKVKQVKGYVFEYVQ